jgi:hypothetical protein
MMSATRNGSPAEETIMASLAVALAGQGKPKR